MLQYVDKSFKEVTGNSVSNGSLVNLFNILKDEEENYLLNIFKSYQVNPELKTNPNFFRYRNLELNDFWENLSFQEYDNEKIWWILPLGNEVINPFEFIDEGETIKVLDESLKSDIIRDIKTVSEY